MNCWEDKDERKEAPAEMDALLSTVILRSVLATPATADLIFISAMEHHLKTYTTTVYDVWPKQSVSHPRDDSVGINPDES